MYHMINLQDPVFGESRKSGACTSYGEKCLVVVDHVVVREGQLGYVRRYAGLPQMGRRVEGGPARVHHMEWEVQDGALARAHQQVLARDTLLRHCVPAQRCDQISRPHE
jgi:hypothetical protein